MGFKTELLYNGSEMLPVNVAVHEMSDNDFDNDLETTRSLFFIQFYNAEGAVVTPTGGTVTPEMAVFPGQWLKASNQANIQANLVGNSYTPSVFEGPATRGRLTFNGITGATHAKAIFWRA